MERVMQRLLAKAVASENQFTLGFIIDGEPEHATQLLDAVGAHFFVQVNDDFRVGMRVEMMAPAFEFGSKFGEVVNLAVENNPGIAIFVEDRLMASGEINNTQAAHAQTGAVGDVEPFIVGAAIYDPIHNEGHRK